MLPILTVGALDREVVGRRGTKQLRKEGYVPALLKSRDRTLNIAVRKELVGRLLGCSHHKNWVVTIILGKHNFFSVLVSAQKQNFSEDLDHLSFTAVETNSPQKVSVPLKIVREEKKASHQLFYLIRRQVEVVCLPQNIPNFLAVPTNARTDPFAIRSCHLVLPEGVRLSIVTAGEDVLAKQIQIQKESSEAGKGSEPKKKSVSA